MEKILIIDDEAGFSKMVQINLEATGEYEVDVAENAFAGFGKIKTKRYDVVLLDVLMPRLSGYGTLEEIKAFKGDTKDLPVIVMSGKHSMEPLFDYFYVRFLPKPFTIEELIEHIDAALGAVKRARKRAGKKMPSESLRGEGVVLAGREDYLLGKIEDFLKELGVQVCRTEDEESTYEQVIRRQPKLILAQFWDDPDEFSAVRIYRELQADHLTKQIPFLAFRSAQGLGLDPLRSIPKNKVIYYYESFDLNERIRDYLEFQLERPAS